VSVIIKPNQKPSFVLLLIGNWRRGTRLCHISKETQRTYFKV